MVRSEPALINRLKRAQGQIGGILKMIEDDRPCPDVLTQLSAVQASLDKTSKIIISNNVKDCFKSTDDQVSADLDDLQAALDLLIKKG